MKTSTLSLCFLALALSASSVACTAGGGDEGDTSEAPIVEMGVPRDGVVAAVIVTGGEFTLEQQVAPAGFPSPISRRLTIAGGVRGQATIVTDCMVCGTGGGVKTLGLPDIDPGATEGKPGLISEGAARNYEIFATTTTCGKIYSGRNGAASVTIHDYRDASPACGAVLAADLVVDETVDGLTTTYFGQAVEVDPT